MIALQRREILQRGDHKNIKRQTDPYGKAIKK